MNQILEEERAWMEAAVAQRTATRFKGLRSRGGAAEQSSPQWWSVPFDPATSTNIPSSSSSSSSSPSIASTASAQAAFTEALSGVTARLRDDCARQVPRLAEQLCEVLAPVLVSGIPAASIVEFSPVGHAARERFLIPKGTRVAGRAPDGSMCIFSSIADVILRPLHLTDVRCDHDGDSGAIMSVTLRAIDATISEALAGNEPMRFMVSGSYPCAATVHAWMVHCCERVDLFAYTSAGWQQCGTLPAHSVCSAGWDPHASLLTVAGAPPVASLGMQHAIEAAMMPAKFLSLDVHGLAPQVALPASSRSGGACRALQLRFVLRDLPEKQRWLAINEQVQMRLHSTPVVNLFVGAADPFLHGPAEESRLLRTTVPNAQNVQVHRVLRVVAQPVGGDVTARSSCQVVGLDGVTSPSSSWAGGSLNPESSGPNEVGGVLARRYRLRREPRTNGSVDTYLSLVDSILSDTARAARSDTVVSVDAELTQGPLAQGLGIGEICLPCGRSPSFATFANFHHVVPFVPPPNSEDLYWHMLDHLRQRFAGPLDREAIHKRLLLAHAITATDDAPRARANMRRCGAVVDVQTQHTQRWENNGLALGLICEVQLDERAFVSFGDAILFAQVVRGLVRECVGANRFVDFVAELVPSRWRARWPGTTTGTMTESSGERASVECGVAVGAALPAAATLS